MLTPETLDALDHALTAVIHEAGHDPKYAELVHALSAAQAALPEEKGESPDDEAAEMHSPAAFADAKAKMTAARGSAAA